MVSYTRNCADYIIKHDIQAAVVTRDMADLVLAAVVNNAAAGHVAVHAPTVESVFQCVHKTRTREEIDPDPIHFGSIDIDKVFTDSWTDFPAILKPCTGTGSRVKKFHYSLTEPIYGNFFYSFVFVYSKCKGRRNNNREKLL